MALIPSQVLRVAILLSYFSILCHYKALDMPAHQTYGGSWKFLTFIDLVQIHAAVFLLNSSIGLPLVGGGGSRCSTGRGGGRFDEWAFPVPPLHRSACRFYGALLSHLCPGLLFEAPACCRGPCPPATHAHESVQRVPSDCVLIGTGNCHENNQHIKNSVSLNLHDIKIHIFLLI